MDAWTVARSGDSARLTHRLSTVTVSAPPPPVPPEPPVVTPDPSPPDPTPPPPGPKPDLAITAMDTRTSCGGDHREGADSQQEVPEADEANNRLEYLGVVC